MRVFVGRGSCGIAAGADRVFESLSEKIDQAGLHLPVETAGCLGMCYLEPIVTVEDGGVFTDYVKTGADFADEFIKFLRGEPNGAARFLMPEKDRAALGRYERVALRNCGRVDPESIEDYICRGGYKELPDGEEIIEQIKISGLAGRGGAGFPTWFKWRAAKDAPGEKKYVVVNADEGDPGAFMDRAILESDPHSVVEGALICARAIGADEGVIYVRAEYPLALKRLRVAIARAEERGIIGAESSAGGRPFTLTIKAGAGAFVCGEETALIASLEGGRGTPRLKPPFPAERGFFGCPTNINNVETYANVPWIIRNGGRAFAASGTETSKGSKVFALAGRIKNGGLIEVPMGVTLRECIFGMGGGIREDKRFKALQLGGPSGGCIPESLLDTPVDYKSLTATGAIMGSGGMVVMDKSACMVDMARFFLDFTCRESCGKCTHCRIGTKRMLEILERIVSGGGSDGDVEALETLGARIKESALCGLGQTAPNPALTSIKYFREEFVHHVTEKKCAAGHCRALLRYTINAAACTGCTLCAKRCPTGAITGELKKVHTVDSDRCTKCGECEKACRFKAVSAA